jgi:hypothetical protein
MKTTLNDTLARSLNLSSAIDVEFETVEVDKQLTIPASKEIAVKDEEYERDLDHAYKKMKNIIEESHDLTETVMQQVLDSQSPRILETIPNLLKSLAELNREFLNVVEKKHLLKTMKEESTSQGSNPSVQNNAIFVGSTEELFRLIGSKKS